MPGVDNPNNDTGDEVLEDETDDGVKKSSMFRFPVLKNETLEIII